MTVGAVVIAYFTDSMPLHCITDTDQAFIKSWQRGWSRLLRRAPQSPSTRTHDKDRRNEREAALTGFILALSDQQLVVGLAILVAAVSNQRTLSIEEFKIAFALAWFSSTTHLATLDNLQQHFHKHPQARNLRIGGMLVLLLFFVYCFSVIWVASTDESSRLVQCYLDGCYTQVPMYQDATMQNCAWLITLLYILVEYNNRILQSYTLPTNGSFGAGLSLAFLKLRLLKFFKKKKYAKVLCKVSLEEWSYILNEANRGRWADLHKKLLLRVDEFKQRHAHHDPALTLPGSQPKTKALSPGPTLARLNIMLLQGSGHVYRRSCLSQAPSLAFMVTYGLTQLIYYRWLEPVFDDTRDMGFGQITPLFLLVLPALVATEIYYGELSARSNSKAGLSILILR